MCTSCRPIETVEWEPLAGSANYVSNDDKYIATWLYADGDEYDVYMTHRQSTRPAERRISNSITIGRLPLRLPR